MLIWRKNLYNRDFLRKLLYTFVNEQNSFLNFLEEKYLLHKRKLLTLRKSFHRLVFRKSFLSQTCLIKMTCVNFLYEKFFSL